MVKEPTLSTRYVWGLSLAQPDTNAHMQAQTGQPQVQQMQAPTQMQSQMSQRQNQAQWGQALAQTQWGQAPAQARDFAIRVLSSPESAVCARVPGRGHGGGPRRGGR